MKTILIVDDDRHTVGVLAETLKALEARIVTAFSGDEAYELINGRDGEPPIRPDLVILDYMLIGSEITGEQLCVILRQAFPEMPIIILSGWADPQEISDILRACGTTFINKPYSPMDVLGRIEKLLGE